MSVRAQRGFTLIEVVVAFAIFALAAGSLFEVYASASKRAVHSAQRAQTLMAAQSLLALQRASPSPWSATQSGSDDAVIWEISTRPHASTAPNDSGWRAFDVDVTVRSALDQA